MKRCVKCILPETFPGVVFNEEGICNFCLKYKGLDDQEQKKKKSRDKFDELIKAHKGKNSFDVVMSYSGGKDSSYTLMLLKEKYDLNILALTFDNGFLPDQVLKNIRNVTAKLNVDLHIYRPRIDTMKKIFSAGAKQNLYSPATLARASTICTSCIAFVKAYALRTAVEKNIPFNAFGWSPGQIPIASSVMKNIPQTVKVMQKALFDPLYSIAGEKIAPYFLEDRHFEEGYSFPFNISPLVFLDYDERIILDKISVLGWKAPENIDANSTNCLLNSLANLIHIERHGYHPYVFEDAGLVREGYMTRSAALRKIEEPQNLEIIRVVKEKLGLSE